MSANSIKDGAATASGWDREVDVVVREGKHGAGVEPRRADLVTQHGAFRQLRRLVQDESTIVNTSA